MRGHSVTDVSEVLFEPSQPGGDGGGHLPEVVVVSLFPHAPCFYQEDVHDHLSSMQSLEVGNKL